MIGREALREVRELLPSGLGSHIFFMHLCLTELSNHHFHHDKLPTRPTFNDLLLSNNSKSHDIQASKRVNMSTEQYDLARRGSLPRDPQASSSRNLADSAQVALVDLNPRVAESKLVDITDIETQFGEVEMTIRTSNRQLPNRRYKDSPLIIRRRVAYNGQPKSTQLEILSQPLRSFLSDILDRYPLLDLSSEVMIIPKPYEPLFYNARAINKHIRTRIPNEQSLVESDSGNESPSDPSSSEIGSVTSPSVEQHRANQIGLETENAIQGETGHFIALKSFMDINLKDTRFEYRRLVKKQRMVSFEILWTLFKPRSRVIEQNDYYVQAYLVESSFLTEQNGVGIQVVDCVSWDYDGICYGPKTKRFYIDSFPGTKRVSALPLYPIQFHDKFKHHSDYSLSRMLVDRGKDWRQLLKNAYCRYQSSKLMVSIIGHFRSNFTSRVDQSRSIRWKL